MTVLFTVAVRREKSFSSKVKYFLVCQIKLKYFYSKDDLWRSCGGCNYEDDGTDIGAVKSKSPSLMVPRLPFQEWEGFNAGESAQQMTGASRAWPGLSLLTLADIKTAAWLVENNHLTHLEKIVFTRDLDMESVKSELETIRTAATNVYTATVEEIIWGIYRVSQKNDLFSGWATFEGVKWP